jgi:hypothetical protein
MLLSGFCGSQLATQPLCLSCLYSSRAAVDVFRWLCRCAGRSPCMQFFRRRAATSSPSTQRSLTSRPAAPQSTAAHALPQDRSPAPNSSMGLLDRLKRGGAAPSGSSSRPTTSSVATRATTVSGCSCCLFSSCQHTGRLTLVDSQKPPSS